MLAAGYQIRVDSQLAMDLTKSTIERELQVAFERVLSVRPDLSDDPIDLGLDSIAVVQILEELEEHLEVELDVERFFDFSSLAECVDYVMAEISREQ